MRYNYFARSPRTRDNRERIKSHPADCVTHTHASARTRIRARHTQHTHTRRLRCYTVRLRKSGTRFSERDNDIGAICHVVVNNGPAARKKEKDGRVKKKRGETKCGGRREEKGKRRARVCVCVLARTCALCCTRCLRDGFSRTGKVIERFARQMMIEADERFLHAEVKWTRKSMARDDDDGSGPFQPSRGDLVRRWRQMTLLRSWLRNQRGKMSRQTRLPLRNASRSFEGSDGFPLEASVPRRSRR